MEGIKLLLVEDDHDWIDGLTIYLSREVDLNVVKAVTTKEDAIAAVRADSYDVVVMDIVLGDDEGAGIEGVMAIQAIRPTHVVMLTSLAEDKAIMDSFAAGALNYVEKADYVQLPHVIRAVFRNARPLNILQEELARLRREEALHSLTPAEREIFTLLELGYTQTQIMKKLYKAESTVKNQVNRILKKLRVRTSREAVAKINGVRQGVGYDDNH
ncbi:response regulator transcription factor [Mechercharimyces sp. CAU 1602]|uniref:response regulator transcription factor n=1 Tax=Mechercharimyces sp. CAU 1602 TaxID=2973933 RepID=UPI0021613BBA|nr:response regulator transcription factor [Mechercharimyces sp. CAU 1602]MCS1351943.1 response regulator transcription factor [Mechercharimyces sp. CAU 1602]